MNWGIMPQKCWLSPVFHLAPMREKRGAFYKYNYGVRGPLAVTAVVAFVIARK
jgi:hypothetical protein